MTTQARVVSKGMRWTQEAAQRAVEGNYYIKVGDRGGSLTLSGASNYWKKNPRFVYLPDVRVAGNPEDVQMVLTQAGYIGTDVQKFMANAYTSQNTAVSAAQGGKAEHFQQEVNNYQQFRQEQQQQKGEATGPTVILDQLEYLVVNLPQAQHARTGSRNSQASGQSGTKTGEKRAGRRVALDQRLRTLPPGKVLDVSNMKDGGVGIKTIAIPGETSGKISISSFPSLVSSNVENFAQALEMLGIVSDVSQQCILQFKQAQEQRSSKSTRGGSSIVSQKVQPRAIAAKSAAPTLGNLPAFSSASVASSTTSTTATSLPTAAKATLPAAPTIPVAQRAALPMAPAMPGRIPGGQVGGVAVARMGGGLPQMPQVGSPRGN